MNRVELISTYLKYLYDLYKRRSLLILIVEIDADLAGYDDKFSDILDIAQFEYEETVKNCENHVMSLEEVLDKLTIENRDKKIDELLD